MSGAIINHACRLSNRLARPLDYAWIGDDFLRLTLHDFVRSKRGERHGSSVPGPLESRKRASKRRMVNAAAVSGSWDIDPSLIPGWGIPAKPRKGRQQVSEGTPKIVSS